jgi:hypothetical protein
MKPVGTSARSRSASKAIAPTEVRARCLRSDLSRPLTGPFCTGAESNRKCSRASLSRSRHWLISHGAGRQAAARLSVRPGHRRRRRDRAAIRGWGGRRRVLSDVPAGCKPLTSAARAHSESSRGAVLITASLKTVPGNARRGPALLGRKLHMKMRVRGAVGTRKSLKGGAEVFAFG